MIIKAEGLSKLFRTDETKTTALNTIYLTVEKGEVTSIMGPSGCGILPCYIFLGLSTILTAESIGF